MEFFRKIDLKIKESDLCEALTLASLENITQQFFVIGEQDLEEASIGGVWGEFTLTRQVIRGGLRFALKECPNGLAWTITTGLPPKTDCILIHLTLNREQIAQEFFEEIEEFLEDHCLSLEKIFSKAPRKNPNIRNDNISLK